jgi:hypothetical protein
VSDDGREDDDSPRIIGETRKYIRDFERLVAQATIARELYDEMLKLYPDWINRGALWTSVSRRQSLGLASKDSNEDRVPH